MSFAVFIVLLALLQTATPTVLAATYTSCPSSGVLQLDSVPLATATFSVSNCAISITSCSADKITFTSSTNLQIVITNLVCSGADTGSGIQTCIEFSELTGGTASAISIDGVNAPAAVTASRHRVVAFTGNVVADLISIKRITIAYSVATSTALELSLIAVLGALSSSGAAGSSVSFSDLSVSGSVTASSMSPSYCIFVMIFFMWPAGSLHSMSKFEVKNNNFGGLQVSFSGDRQMDVYLLLFSEFRRLEGGAARTNIFFSSNSMADVGVSTPASATGQLNLRMAWFDVINSAGDLIIQDNTAARLRAVGNVPEIHMLVFAQNVGVRSVTVNSFDMTNVFLDIGSGAANGAFDCLALNPAAVIGGALWVSNVHLGGQFAYRGSATALIGAKVLWMASPFASSAMSITDCTLDFNRMSTTQTALTAVVAMFLRGVNGVQQLTISRCRISGEYIAVGSSAGTEVSIVRFSSGVTATTWGSSDALTVTDNSIVGSYSSAFSFVCLAVLLLESASSSISDYETINSAGSVVNAHATAGAPHTGTAYGAGSIMLQCGNAQSFTSQSSTTSSTTTTATSTTTSTITSSTTTVTSLTTTSTTSTATTTTTTTLTSTTTTQLPTPAPPATTPKPTSAPPPTTTSSTTTTSATTISTTTVQEANPLVTASLSPGMPPPGTLVVTLKQRAASFDKNTFKETLAKEIGYPPTLIAVSEPNGEGKVTVTLLGANQTQVDESLKKAAAMRSEQLQRLGASEIVVDSQPKTGEMPQPVLPLWAIIAIATGGALLIIIAALLAFVLVRRRRKGDGESSAGQNQQAFIHTAMSAPAASDGGAATAGTSAAAASQGPLLKLPRIIQSSSGCGGGGTIKSHAIVQTVMAEPERDTGATDIEMSAHEPPRCVAAAAAAAAAQKKPASSAPALAAASAAGSPRGTTVPAAVKAPGSATAYLLDFL